MSEKIIQNHFKVLLNSSTAVDQVDDSLSLIVKNIQKFVEANYTNIENADSVLAEESVLMQLSIGGQRPYEFLKEAQLFLSIKNSIKNLVEEKKCNIENVQKNTSEQLLCIYWYCRIICIHLSFFTENVLMGEDAEINLLQSFFKADKLLVAALLEEAEDLELREKIEQMYYLESCKVSILLQNEHLYAADSLNSYSALSKMVYVLTGCKTQRTRYQTKFHNNLIILADSDKSQILLENSLFSSTKDATVENLTLNHETLLDRPVFSKQEGKEENDENINLPEYNNKFLNTVSTSVEIPARLADLDYNKQPKLTFFDEIQFLLRLEAIKVSSPAKDPLVEQELMAIIDRLTSTIDGCNSLIFTHTLWERSLIETNKAKTIERALLQMEQLINDLQDSAFNLDSQFFYLLLPKPTWTLQSQLAEKYMELGVVKSAMEIYKRLHMINELALCHCAVGEEEEGLKLLEARLVDIPTEYRAMSIIGDIKQDPKYWEEAWNKGSYINAKISLAKHSYYKLNDPKEAMKHFEEANILRQSFDNIYLYGCLAIQTENWDSAKQAFQKCVQMDETSLKSWSNLGAALMELSMYEQAHSSFSKAVSLTNSSAATSKNNWQVIQNLMILSLRLQKWNDVLNSYIKLIESQNLIDMEVIQELFAQLTNESNSQMYQNKLIDFFERILPNKVSSINSPAVTDVYKILSRYELLQKRPWNALSYTEVSFRHVINNVSLTTDKTAFLKAVEELRDLLSSYENLGPRDGRLEGSFVCKNWKYKCKMTVKLLIGKCSSSWSNEPEWEELMSLRAEY
ncbi:hypothetical protein QEN19_004079 [Hanseniaspora menglaensis]